MGVYASNPLAFGGNKIFCWPFKKKYIFNNEISQ